MKLSLLVVLIFSLILCSILLDVANAYSPPPYPRSPPSGVPSFCAGKCDYRCSRNWRKSFCVKLCMTCCGKCKCVPSSPFADKGECPCYRDMKNPKGRPKCP